MNTTTSSERRQVDRRAARLNRTPSSRDYGSESSVADGKWGQVAQVAAERARVKPGTVHGWLHSTTQLKPAERVALLMEVCSELHEHQLLAQILAPIRAAEITLPLLPLRQLLHDLREADALVGVMLLRLFDGNTEARKGLLSALIWSTHCAHSAIRALRAEVLA